jgi:hypothetical protein
MNRRGELAAGVLGTAALILAVVCAVNYRLDAAMWFGVSAVAFGGYLLLQQVAR